MSQKFLTSIDLTLNELLNAKLQILASDPGSPVEGQVWYNSTTKMLKFYTGSATIVLGRLDQISAPTAALSLNSQRITSLADPTAATDAATKQYVDNLAAGINWKDSVRAATTANGALATAFENGDAIDGVTLATGDRILIKNQSTGSENGIYTVNASGAPTRASDADTAAEILGAAVFVEEGTVNPDSMWVLTTNAPITLGSTSLTFAKFASVASSLSRVAANVGDGSATQIDVTHSLGTRDITVLVYRNSSPWDQVFCDVEMLDANTVRLRFATAPSSNQYRVVVIG